jgi:hypothetical protein
MLVRGAHDGSEVLLHDCVFVLMGDHPPRICPQPLDEVLPHARIQYEVEESCVSVPLL